MRSPLLSRSQPPPHTHQWRRIPTVCELLPWTSQVMKVHIDSYYYHRFFGDVYPEQHPPASPFTMEQVIDRAHELGCESISLESCFHCWLSR
jgi:hypothetical protein